MSTSDDADRFIANVFGTGFITFLVFAAFEAVGNQVPRAAIGSPVREVVLGASISALICFGTPWLRKRFMSKSELTFHDRSRPSGVIRARLVGIFVGVIGSVLFIASIR